MSLGDAGEFITDAKGELFRILEAPNVVNACIVVGGVRRVRLVDGVGGKFVHCGCMSDAGSDWMGLTMIVWNIIIERN